MMTPNIVAMSTFIDAIRDAGYRGPAAALAELVDNAFEANATTVRIDIAEGTSEPIVTVVDDGCGMKPSILPLALQFGGSTRFGSRRGLGRYGMGLPAGSVSQARRVDVFTWTRQGHVFWSFLDVDRIREGLLDVVPAAVRKEPPVPCATSSGTTVIWSDCDRLRGRLGKRFLSTVRSELGRIFREQLWTGREIVLNGESVDPIDPLLRAVPFHQRGATEYGPPLDFEIQLTDADRVARRSKVSVQFVELPIAAWHGLSNADKRAFGIAKGGGISVLRAEREIDFGWFFTGTKRRENYDDWWRCEIRFEPELDEFFGVTHTKQGIHPTPKLEAILSPHIERVAHELNRRVRASFVTLKKHQVESLAAAQATRMDRLIEPPRRRASEEETGLKPRGKIRGLLYRIEHRKLAHAGFFDAAVSSEEVRLTINEHHAFFRAAYAGETAVRRVLELVLLAAARAEARFRTKRDKEMLRQFRDHWSRVLAAFMA
jgi:hypothetical protein